MKLYLSDYIENEKNPLYPHELEINSLDDMRKAAGRDHMACRMKSHYRHKSNFLGADCIMFDIDNTHTEDPHAWVTEDDIAEAFPVKYYLVRSRNYMKIKETTNKKTGEKTFHEAREKWHVYMPLREPVTDPARYEKMMLFIMSCFPYIDVSATDTARLFYGVKDPYVTEEQADQCIDEFGRENWAELKEKCKDVIEGFADRVKKGTYEDTEGTRDIVAKVSAFLKIPDPLTKKSGDDPGATNGGRGDNAPEWLIYLDQSIAEDWLKGWAEKNAVTLGKRYVFKHYDKHSNLIDEHTVAYCVTCPWEEEHSMNGAENEAVIQISSAGVFGFKCRHSHGPALNWKKYRAKVEAETKKRKQQETAQKATETAGAEARGQTAPADELAEFFEQIQTEAYKPYQTGLSFFDNLLGGGMISQTVLLILAAPAAGKTTLCQQIAEEIARRQKPVIFLNLEMSRNQMLAKAISATASQMAKSKITAMDVMQGYRWDGRTRTIITKAYEEYRANVYPYMKYNPEEVGAELDDIKQYLDKQGQEARAAGTPAPAVVLDYLHLVTAPEFEQQTVIKKTVTAIKDYCKDYDTFAIVISAINRVSSGSGRITMESGRDSSNIEYGCDAQISLNYWEVDQGLTSANNEEEMGALKCKPLRRMILRVLKARFYEAGRYANVYFHAATNRFYGENDFLPDYIPLHEVEQFVKPKPEQKTPRAGRKRGEKAADDDMDVSDVLEVVTASIAKSQAKQDAAKTPQAGKKRGEK